MKPRPDFTVAHNSIAAHHMEMGEWNAAIAAASEAVRLKPDPRLARNNLAYARQKKKLAAGKNQ